MILVISDLTLITIKQKLKINFDMHITDFEITLSPKRIESLCVP